ncbi:hypothetical protein H0274_13720 [Altererythrobacter sp. CC-YST694]|uniref:hypothetical protein n=1 Tax=Altererythrobacter sp. CC-YST694 TaxID=2755038 RepID=UPI001D00B2D4|nr:hypothetical protein [Altererythrobacter sp. CC-YST694]MCB5426321.1 hypothetical protein [Altererythrobacter sp. CC-YST694]
MSNSTVTPIRSRTKTKAAPTRTAKPVQAEAVAVRLSQMCQMLNVGLTKGQELVKSGAVESTLVGKTRLISVRSIKALVGEVA